MEPNIGYVSQLGTAKELTLTTDCSNSTNEIQTSCLPTLSTVHNDNCHLLFFIDGPSESTSDLLPTGLTFPTRSVFRVGRARRVTALAGVIVLVRSRLSMGCETG